MEQGILEILKFTIPAVVVMVLTIYLVRAYGNRELKLKEAEIRKDSRKELIPIRLQAYERLALFLERISLDRLISRSRKPGMSAHDLQLVMISNVRMEFEHNMAQQIYLNQESWDAIKLCKDEMIRIINTIAGPMKEEATGEELTRAVLDFVIKSKEPQPTQRAMDTLKEEVVSLF